jgi:hypothetical protein
MKTKNNEELMFEASTTEEADFQTYINGKEVSHAEKKWQYAFRERYTMVHKYIIVSCKITKEVKRFRSSLIQKKFDYNYNQDMRSCS